MNYKSIKFGNWIESKSSFLPWQVMTDDFEYIKNNPDHYSYIELTNEWFLKLGLKSCPLDWFVIDGLLSTCLYEGQLRIAIENKIVFPNIKYVHEFQNLINQIIDCYEK